MIDLLSCRWIVLLANVSLKALLLGALALAILRALRVDAPAVRYATGLALAVGMLLSPAVSLLVPEIWLPLVPRFPDPLAPLLRAGIPPYTFVVLLYATGVLVHLTRVGLATWSIHRVLRAARFEFHDQTADVFSSPIATVPFTCGVRRARIVLPPEWRTWPGQTLASVLAHERAHVVRRDAAARLVLAVVRAFFWFLPIVPWLARLVSLEAERACDREAIRATGDARSYGECLLTMAARGEGRLLATDAAIALIEPHHLETRLDDIIRAAGAGLPDAPRRAAAIAFTMTLLAWLALSNLWIVSVAESLRRGLA